MSLFLTKTILQGSNNDGFVNSSHNFSIFGVSSGLFRAIKNSVEANTTYIGSCIQGATQNRYSDWGVPSTAKILSVRLVSHSSAVILDANGTLSAYLAFYTEEAFLGQFGVGDGLEGDPVDVSTNGLTGNSFVRLTIEATCDIGVNPELSDYGNSEIQLNDYLVEIEYELKKAGMFFGV